LEDMEQVSEERWQAVATRDARFDGAFVYAVRSTGIYCRPSCPSRRPGRPHVAFFPLPEAAERAGFRSCLRCRPRTVHPRDPQAERVQRVCRYIADHLDQPLTLARLGRFAGAAPHHLQRTFKDLMGISPRAYADALRLGVFRRRVKKGAAVIDATFAAGYGSTSRLYERASGQLGMTPAAFRRGGQGAQIVYTIADSPLGRLLVAATERGVALVSLGADDRALTRMLHDEYPAAEKSTGAPGLEAWVRRIVAHLAGREPHLDLPLDVRATAFQWRVWQELRAIPRGETRSYADVARAIGRPTAARAVARACATNPVALVVPCHRVVPQAGGTGGYRWGRERKARLLETEAAGARRARAGRKA
jgi:AraC family transcriptional regulator, regulatory protein of adaptative response / methylated-DNA-[protein]-cysteine methyltransferase